MSLWLLVLLGCTTPQTIADCGGLSGASAQEECRFTLLKAQLPQDGSPTARKAFAATLDQALAQIPDVSSRDLLLLRLAIASPATAGFLCTKVETEGARQKCEQVLGRPHLGTTPRTPPGQGPATPPPEPR